MQLSLLFVSVGNVHVLHTAEQAKANAANVSTLYYDTHPARVAEAGGLLNPARTCSFTVVLYAHSQLHQISSRLLGFTI
jgi:hypothetical protein